MKLLGLGTVAVDDLLHVAAYPPADGNGNQALMPKRKQPPLPWLTPAR